jgi:hypothetical protein
MSRLAQPRAETVQARKMFLAGHTITEIKLATKMSWLQARYHADPDGDWHITPVPKACSMCCKVKQPSEFGIANANPDRLSCRCVVCARDYSCLQARERRHSKKPRRAVKAPAPVILYGCHVCGMQRTQTGRWFKTQHDADQCCAGIKPIYRHSVLHTRGRFMMLNDRI